MRITEQDVRRLAQLSRLDLNREETGDMVSQLDKILACMQTLENVHSEVEQNRDEAENVLRPDVCVESAPRANMLANAPEQDGAYILVPRTVE